MLEAVVMGLIYIAIVVLVVYVALWVLEQLGLPLPAQVIKIIWVIVALVALLVILRLVLPGIGLGKL